MMKSSMKMAMDNFCTHRMVQEYEKKFYIEAGENSKVFLAEGAQKAKQMLKQRQRLISMWKHIKINPPARKEAGPFVIGESFLVTAEVVLGDIRPEEVEVEVYYGKLKAVDKLSESRTQHMEVEKNLGDGRYIYACRLKCDFAGQFGFTVRVFPTGDDYLKFTPGLISWA
jgi:starch phosphorylase